MKHHTHLSASPAAVATEASIILETAGEIETGRQRWQQSEKCTIAMTMQKHLQDLQYQTVLLQL